jgi:hypothetical protein
VDDRCEALEIRLRHFLLEHYNHKPHEALGGRTPVECWESDRRELRLMTSDDDLRRRFLLSEMRSVSNDHVLSVDGTAYETPRGYGGRRVEIFRCALEQTVSILHDGRLLRLHPLDVVANATAGRAKPTPRDHQHADPNPPVYSAARLAYERDLGPIVDDEGGFAGTDNDHHHKEEE